MSYFIDVKTFYNALYANIINSHNINLYITTQTQKASETDFILLDLGIVYDVIKSHLDKLEVLGRFIDEQIFLTYLTLS